MEERWISLELPSLGKVYENNDGNIEVRTLKGKDEKLLAELTADNFEKKFSILLQNTIKGINDIKELTLGDRFFILVWQRINSYSKDYEITRTCPYCNTEVTDTVDLSKLDLKYLPDGFSEPYAIKIGETGKQEINVKLLRIKDEIEAVNYEKKGKNGWLYRMALSLVDNEKDIQEKLLFLENLSSRDTSKIRAFHEKYDHGVNMETELQCPICERRAVTLLPFRIDLIFPTSETIIKYFGDGI